ncbi:MAG TPA: hypothetical protein VJ302_03250 [Blastocatellia bacterium]|nr:hypothetical protein [Blastocatellia bacterium]
MATKNSVAGEPEEEEATAPELKVVSSRSDSGSGREPDRAQGEVPADRRRPFRIRFSGERDSADDGNQEDGGAPS